MATPGSSVGATVDGSGGGVSGIVVVVVEVDVLVVVARLLVVTTLLVVVTVVATIVVLVPLVDVFVDVTVVMVLVVLDEPPVHAQLAHVSPGSQSGALSHSSPAAGSRTPSPQIDSMAVNGRLIFGLA